MRPASPMMSDGETGKPCEAVFSEEAEQLCCKAKPKTVTEQSGVIAR